MLISELGYGGAEGAFLRLAEALAAEHQVELAVFQRSYRIAGYAATDIEVGLPLHLLDDEQRAKGPERWRRRSARLGELKQKLRPDAVISFLSGPNLLNAVTGGPGLKLVSIRGSRRYGSHMRPAARMLYHRLVDPVTHRLADGVVGCSEGVTREISGTSPGNPPPFKFRTIAGYVDAEALIAAAAEPPPPGWEELHGTNLICGFGRLAADKGFQHLIALLPQVRKRVPDTRLLLVGDGPYWGALKQACEREGLRWSENPRSEAEVLFAGYQPKPLRFAGLSRVHVLASDTEGLPNVLVEGLASGAKVMTGDIPWGVRDILGVAPDRDNRPYPRTEPFDAGLGWLMPRIDVPSFREQWAEKIAHGLEDRSDQTERVEAARQRVRDLDVRHAARRWISFIAELQAAKG